MDSGVEVADGVPAHRQMSFSFVEWFAREVQSGTGGH